MVKFFKKIFSKMWICFGVTSIIGIIVGKVLVCSWIVFGGQVVLVASIYGIMVFGFVFTREERMMILKRLGVKLR